MRSFKRNENIHKIEDGSYYVVSANIRFDLEKLDDSTVMSAFQATIGGRFASFAPLADEDADLDSIVTHVKKAVTDTAAVLLDSNVGGGGSFGLSLRSLISLIFVSKYEN